MRQLVDGASQIDEKEFILVIGTTNKHLEVLPDDLLHRVLFHIPFDQVSDPTIMRKQFEAFKSSNARLSGIAMLIV